MADARNSRQPIPPAVTPRVLLVDPNRVFLRTLERTLHPDKYEIRTVQTVLDALAEISRREFDLVISETQFSGLTGFDLLRRLRDGSRGRDLAVVLITSNLSTSDSERAREFGVADMLLKPVRPQLVRQRIRKVLEAHGCFETEESLAEDPTAEVPPIGGRDVEALAAKQKEAAEASPRIAPRRPTSDGGSIARILTSSVRKKKPSKKISPLADPRMREVRVPTFRAATQHILQLLSHPDATVRQVARIVETDPGLSTSVLRIVNSAYYGLKKGVSTVPDACALLGLRDLGSICLGASVSEALLIREDAVSRSCWSHCLATGYAAGELGKLLGISRNSDPGVAGILSGIGILATVASPEIDHQAIAERVETRHCRWAEAERDLLGFDHAELGGAIARQWGMPPWIGRVIEGSEDPARVGRPDEWVVALGSFAVQWKRRGSFPRHPDPVASIEDLARCRPKLWERVAPRLDAIVTAAWEQPDPAGVLEEG